MRKRACLAIFIFNAILPIIRFRLHANFTLLHRAIRIQAVGLHISPRISHLGIPGEILYKINIADIEFLQCLRHRREIIALAVRRIQAVAQRYLLAIGVALSGLEIHLLAPGHALKPLSAVAIRPDFQNNICIAS